VVPLVAFLTTTLDPAGSLLGFNPTGVFECDKWNSKRKILGAFDKQMEICCITGMGLTDTQSISVKVLVGNPSHWHRTVAGSTLARRKFEMKANAMSVVLVVEMLAPDALDGASGFLHAENEQFSVLLGLWMEIQHLDTCGVQSGTSFLTNTHLKGISL